MKYKKRFLKDLARLPSRDRDRIEKIVFHELPEMKNSMEYQKLQKLVGYTNYYKIRVGDYRIGILVNDQNNTFVFSRVLHRKEIYRSFP